ncbi:MAG: T9SS type A sorting domain-containing protein [Flavobacterium sp.]|uniref:T9SS type A sorting domain-containing protein n=1 Tax=Flavobacterium sp. TaxID=239 RepID=UPI001228BE37|nr:T9SS type A sorting domain-containing protein [Flavobacterium sp.]RZJ66336.1 MAG: T9SS type A sorting domain-containing protein [Flavobacterium sp.]
MLYDLDFDNEISMDEAAVAGSLFIFGENIESVGGIQYFTNANTIMVVQTSVPTLDLTVFPNLYDVSLMNNALLTTINFDTQPNIWTLEIIGNAVELLDLTGLTALTHVEITQNTSLTGLLFAELTSVQSMWITHNGLTEIDLSNVATADLDLSYNELETIVFPSSEIQYQLDISGNNFTSIDLSGIASNTFTSHLVIEETNLSALDFSFPLYYASIHVNNNSQLQTINFQNESFDGCASNCNVGQIEMSNNPALASACVDAFEVWTTNPDFWVDGQTWIAQITGNPNLIFNTDCSLESIQTEFHEAKLFPNPANNRFMVSSSSDISSVNIYSISGLLLQHTNADARTNSMEIPIYGLSSGTYFVEILSSSGKQIKKIVKL